GGIYNPVPQMKPLAPGQAFSLGLRGYGIASSAAFNGQPLPLPAAANDIGNTMTGGFPIASQLGSFVASNPANGYAGTWVPVNTS
ncbi:MAG: hypothetical protein ACYCQK_11500, partial [Acidiferrobacteraceae bacterium]